MTLKFIEKKTLSLHLRQIVDFDKKDKFEEFILTFSNFISNGFLDEMFVFCLHGMNIFVVSNCLKHNFINLWLWFTVDESVMT